MEQFYLWYPIKPNRINQIFGNPDPKYLQLKLKGHNGIDFYALRGAKVYASHDGILTNEPVDSYGGHGATIVSSQGFDYKNSRAFFKTIYWHFLPIVVRKDGPVKVGDLIGYANNTGFTTGDHLHFGLKVLDEDYKNIEQNNGYLGAIDPSPYFNGFYSQDQEQVLSLYRRVILLLQKFLHDK